MSLVHYELHGAAAWITLADPDRGNAFSAELAADLSRAVRRVRDDRPRVVVLRAQGRFFSVGGDIAGMGSADDLGGFIEDLATEIHRSIADLQRCDAVVVSVLQGTAAGIGVALAGAADLVLAADTARLTLGYTKLGLVGDGGTGMLTRTLGLHRTLRLVLLNDVLTAAEAEQAGFVARVFPSDELDAGVRQVVDQLTAGPAYAQAQAKHLVRATASADLETQLRREAAAMGEAGRSDDAREGVTAFLDRRSPEFGGER